VAEPGDDGTATDWDALRDCIHDAVRFPDDVVEANQNPLPAIAQATRATRKIGLGVMGLADLLIDLGIPYDDDRALAVGADIAAYVERESLAASAALATERGPFPAFGGSRWDLGGHPLLRNATTTTVAPTGTISIIAGCSSGIEPLFAVAHDRHVLDGAVLPELHPGFVRRAAARGFLDDDLIASLRGRGGALGLAAVTSDLQALFATAHDVPIERHVRMQAAFQRHVHAAVSKTINLPNDASPDDVRAAYVFAYAQRCKGVTVYRDGSRSTQVWAFGEVAAARPPSERCPACGGELRDGGRCKVCLSCAWSACG